MAASRLPGKPLADIGGRPMVVHVMLRAMRAGVGPVAVACADVAIAEAVREAGGAAVMTEPALPSGSDRVWAALQTLDPAGAHDVVVNLQGDFPTLEPADLAQALRPLDDPSIDIGTLVVAIADRAEAERSSVVKAVCEFRAGDRVSRALYFSRAAVPWGDGPRWHHIGVYAWRRPALARFVALPPSALERREGLEQLRALDAGMAIGCARIDAAPFGVDTPDDLVRARLVLAAEEVG